MVDDGVDARGDEVKRIGRTGEEKGGKEAKASLAVGKGRRLGGGGALTQGPAKALTSPHKPPRPPWLTGTEYLWTHTHDAYGLARCLAPGRLSCLHKGQVPRSPAGSLARWARTALFPWLVLSALTGSTGSRQALLARFGWANLGDMAVIPALQCDE